MRTRELHDGPTDQRAEGHTDRVTYGGACSHLKIIEGVDNDDDKDNNKEDLIPFVLLQNGLNLPASMKLEDYY